MKEKEAYLNDFYSKHLKHLNNKIELNQDFLLVKCYMKDQEL